MTATFTEGGNRGWIAAAVLAVVAALVSGAPQMARAHAVVVSTSPANGAQLDQAPNRVTVQFSEPVEAAFQAVTVLDANGHRVDRGGADVRVSDPARVATSLPPLGPGIYTAVYRVTSADGHPIQGSLTFTVGPADSASPAAPNPAFGAAQTQAQVLSAVGFIHGGVLLVVVLLVGLTAFARWVWPPPLPAALSATPAPSAPPLRGLGGAALTLAGALLVLGAAELGLYAVRASGEPLSARLLGQALFGSRVGILWLLRVGLAGLTALALARVPTVPGALQPGALQPGALRPGALQRRAWQRRAGLNAIALLPAAALLFTVSQQSHAAAARDITLLLADWLHLVAAAVWTGGVFGFAFLAWPTLRRHPPAEARQWLGIVVPRFSRLAIGAVGLLIGTGLVGSLQHIPSWSGLIDTDYGRVLLVKVALLVPLLGLGLYNLVRRGGGTFRGVVIAEAALLLGATVAAGFLTSIPPAGVELLGRQGPFQQQAVAQGYAIALRIDPARIGLNRPELTVTTTGGKPETEAAVGLRVRKADHDMTIQNLNCHETTPGVYPGEPVVFAMDGEWQVEVALLTRSGQEVRHTFLVAVPAP